MPDLETVPEAEIQSASETVNETDIPATEAEKESEESRRLKNIERRIGRLTREKHQARAEADFYRQQAAQKPQESGEAKPLTSEDLEAAFTEFQQRTESQKKAERIQSKLNSVMDSDADFADALETSDVIFSDQHLQIMQDMVDEGETGIEVLKYIAKTPDEAERLSQLSPTALARELGRLETKVLALKKPQTSNAPKPIDTLKGSASPAMPDPKNTEAWIKWRNESLKKK